MKTKPYCKYSIIFLNILMIMVTTPSFSVTQTEQERLEMDKNLKHTLVQEAIKASKLAYAPYSHYMVGAALLTKSGTIFAGSNIENASYGLASCAERNTIFKAVTEGEKDFVMIAVVTKDGGFSCGACRQVMNEFNPELLVIIANDKGEILHEKPLSKLLPHAFGPGNLDKK